MRIRWDNIAATLMSVLGGLLLWRFGPDLPRVFLGPAHFYGYPLFDPLLTVTACGLGLGLMLGALRLFLRNS